MRYRYLLSQGIRQRYSLNRNVKIKVGHGGTLDPLAEGVLVLGVGVGTKLLDEYLSGAKTYIADINLGSETDTLDRTGTIEYLSQ